MNNFFYDLEREWDFEILLLQEFTLSPKLSNDFFLDSGHRVYLQPPCSGRYRAAIVIHKDFVQNIKSDPVTVGRHMGIEIALGTTRLWTICAHMSASQTVAE